MSANGNELFARGAKLFTFTLLLLCPMLLNVPPQGCGGV